jgi:hypothetical protein
MKRLPMTEYFVSYCDPETKTVKTGFVDARTFKGVRMNLAAEHEAGESTPIDDEFARRLGAPRCRGLQRSIQRFASRFRSPMGKGTASISEGLV